MIWLLDKSSWFITGNPACICSEYTLQQFYCGYTWWSCDSEGLCSGTIASIEVWIMGTPLFYEYSAHYDRGDGIEKEGDGKKGWKEMEWSSANGFDVFKLRFPEKVLVCCLTLIESMLMPEWKIQKMSLSSSEWFTVQMLKLFDGFVSRRMQCCWLQLNW